MTEYPKTSDKTLLRKELLAKRKELSEAYRRNAGESIQQQILSSPEYAAARSLFVYMSMPGEPPTERIIRRALSDGKEVYVPKCVGGELFAVRIRSTEEMQPGTMGILEPTCCAETKSADEFDLILVPCVSVSSDGRRLGHGGGYYDRFLARERSNTLCLCFKHMLCKDIPVEETDVRIARVISEK